MKNVFWRNSALAPANRTPVAEAALCKKLDCVMCDKPLTVSPVFTILSGGSVCGRCWQFVPMHLMTRAVLYENVARLLRFPCVNRGNGCLTRCTMRRMRAHEKNCYYRMKSCTHLNRACRWTGVNLNWRNHCESEHKNKLKALPLRFKFVARNRTCTYLGQKFGFIFFIHYIYRFKQQKFKLCVQLLAEPRFNNRFIAELLIENRRTTIQHSLPVQCHNVKLAISEYLAVDIIRHECYDVAIDIRLTNNGCYSCTRSLQSLDPNVLSNGNFCSDCTNVLDDYVQEECMYKSRGCIYFDDFINVSKHERYACAYVTGKYDFRGSVFFNNFLKSLRGKQMAKSRCNYVFVSDNMPSGFVPGAYYEQMFSPDRVVRMFIKLKYSAMGYFEVSVLSNIPKTRAKNIECQLVFQQGRRLRKVVLLRFSKRALDYDWRGVVDNKEAPFIKVAFIHNQYKGCVRYELHFVDNN